MRLILLGLNLIVWRASSEHVDLSGSSSKQLISYDEQSRVVCYEYVRVITFVVGPTAAAQVGCEMGEDECACSSPDLQPSTHP